MKKVFITIILISSSFLFSCEKWLDVNKDPDAPDPSAVKENVLLPGILATTVYEITAGYPARWPNYWLGQLTFNAAAPDESTFDIDESDVNNTWTYSIYTGTLKNAKILMTQSQANNNYYYLGISQVLIAYILTVTTDLWGDIPWTQTFDQEKYPFPDFDTQEKIYIEVMKLLDDAIANFNKQEAGQMLLPGDDDYIYNGDVAQWQAFANTLKARFAMHLTYAPGKSGSAQADIALAALENGLVSNDDNPSVPFLDKTDAENPWYQWQQKWVNQLYANTFIVDLMSQNNDPRLSAYFTQPGSAITGAKNGTLLSTAQARNISQYQPELYAADASVPIITYTEAKFIQAEAYLWKGDTVHARESLDEAVMASFSSHNITDTALTNSFVRQINKTSMKDFEAAQQLIIEQKYIANIFSIENWNDYRRTGYPRVSAADTDNPTHSSIPVRFLYGSDTRLVSANKMPDVDWLTDRLWWDTKNK